MLVYILFCLEQLYINKIFKKHLFKKFVVIESLNLFNF